MDIKKFNGFEKGGSLLIETLASLSFVLDTDPTIRMKEPRWKNNRNINELSAFNFDLLTIRY